MSVLPSIGMTGVWPLKSPLDNYLPANAVFVCRAVRSINEYIAQNTDPFVTIYTPLGLGQDIYDVDYANNDYIVSLQGMEGTWEYIPASHIEGYPLTSGVMYERKAIIATFPALPSDTDYSLLETKFTEAAGLVLGVTPTLNQVPVGHQYIMDLDAADADMTARRVLMSTVASNRVYIQKLENQVANLQDLLNQIVMCSAASCLVNDGAVRFPTFNKDTPGHTGYIDGADLTANYMYRPLIGDNATDIFLYGQTSLPYGIRTEWTGTTGGGIMTAITSRGDLFTPEPTETESGELPAYRDESQINSLFPVSAADLVLDPVRDMRISHQFSLGSVWPSSGELYRSGPISGSLLDLSLNDELIMMIIQMTMPLHVEDMDGSELYVSTASSPV